MNYVAVVINLFVPWILFCLVLGVTSFYLHFSRPLLCWLFVGLAGLFVCGVCTSACQYCCYKIRHVAAEYDPTWLIFLFFSSLIAVILGVTFGDMIYESFMQRYYEYTNLNHFNFVDVSKMRGEELMDGARLTFQPGTSLDLRKTTSFINVNTYCVAPITRQDTNGVKSELANYDFWAVGLNCCNADNTDFHCGEYNNPKARGAIRVLEDDDRAFYRLAVQQAEGLYHIKAQHPLFLYWTEDPHGEMESWREEGYKFFFIAMLVHFAFQILMVVLAVLGFRKMGHL